MSNTKLPGGQVPPYAKPAVTRDLDEASKPLVKPKVVKLEIDDESFAGGDPYNHTGSHYVRTIRDDKA